MPKGRQAITWTNADPVHRRIYEAPGGDEFNSVSCMAGCVSRFHLHLEITFNDLTKGYFIVSVVLVMATRVTCPLSTQTHYHLWYVISHPLTCWKIRFNMIVYPSWYQHFMINTAWTSVVACWRSLPDFMLKVIHLISLANLLWLVRHTTKGILTLLVLKVEYSGRLPQCHGCW